MFRYAEPDKKKVQDNSKPRRGLSAQQASAFPAAPVEQKDHDAANPARGGSGMLKSAVMAWRKAVLSVFGG